MVDMAETPEELFNTLSILRDLLKDSWQASEEMERIREIRIPNLVKQLSREQEASSYSLRSSDRRCRI